MNRRDFARGLSLIGLSVLSPISFGRGRCPTKIHLTGDQAKTLIWGDLPMEPLSVKLTEQQMKAIQEASGVWVRKRSSNIRALKSSDNHWLIYDQVIGKHENIDLAVGITNQGAVKGVEILVYRESYGCEILHPKWLGQFLAKGSSDPIEIESDIVNISGATLSCVHVTDGVSRLTHTWDQVLRNI